MLSKLDQFLAKRIFGPPIIRYCQWTGASQYRAAKELDFVGWLVALWQSRDSPFWFLFVFGTMALAELIGLALWPDNRAREFSFYRPMLIILIGGNVLFLAIDASFSVPLLFFLAASYANDIDNIPPREKKNLTRARIALG